MNGTVELREFSQVSRARRIDEDKGILYDIVALGGVGQNSRRYPESTMRRALPLFEGRQAFANHTPKGSTAGPSIYDCLGVWQDCRVEGGKVRGNFHYFRSHPLAERLVEAARRPELARAMGFSIVGNGRTVRKNGVDEVQELTDLSSCDLVALPATCTLAESITPSKSRKATPMRLKTLIEKLARRRPLASRVLRELTGPAIPGRTPASGIMSGSAGYGDTSVDNVPDDVETDDGAADEAVRSALSAVWTAIFDAHDGDDAETLKKVKQILQTHKQLLGKDGEGAAGDATAEGRRRPFAANLRESSSAQAAEERAARVARMRRTR